MAPERMDTDDLVVRALLDGGVRVVRGDGEYRLLVQPNLFGGVDLVWRGPARPRPADPVGARPRLRAETHPDLFELESALRRALARPVPQRRSWRRCYGAPATRRAA